MSGYYATSAIIITEDDELDLLLPLELPEDAENPIYLLMAVHYLATTDHTCNLEIMEQVKDDPEFMSYLDEQTEETVH